MKEKGLSKGELASVVSALGGIEALVDPENEDQQTVELLQYLASRSALRQTARESAYHSAPPSSAMVAQATIGYQPDVWGQWQ